MMEKNMGKNMIGLVMIKQWKSFFAIGTTPALIFVLVVYPKLLTAIRATDLIVMLARFAVDHHRQTRLRIRRKPFANALGLFQ